MSTSQHPARRIHPAWWVALATFLALFGAAGFRAAPGALMIPLHHEFGWSMWVMSLAVSVNLLLYGLVAPFAAALMQRFGVRRVVTAALALVALGAAGSTLMNASWQLFVFWGVLIGGGTGAMALVLADTVASRWFVRSRGLVMGVLTAGQAAGQLVLLPPVASLADSVGWRSASLLIAAAALIALIPVLLLLRERPSDLGVLPYGRRAPGAGHGTPGEAGPEGERTTSGASVGEPLASRGEAPGGPDDGWAGEEGPAPGRGAAAGREAMRHALDVLRRAAKTRVFWALAGAFAICGATTNGLVGVHFIPSTHDHGMPAATAATLLAAVGVLDVAGTMASGWLTDRFDPRILLGLYYGFRGVSLVLLPFLLSDAVHPSMVLFVVVYGLDWVATVPPTAALCRQYFGEDSTVVFGWVFAAHQVGAAIAAAAAGGVRELFGEYTYAWWGGAALCVVAVVLSLAIGRRPGARSRVNAEA